MTNSSTVHDKATQYNTNPDELPQVGLEPMTQSVLGMYFTNKATEAAQKAEFKSPIQIKAKQNRNCVHLMNWQIHMYNHVLLHMYVYMYIHVGMLLTGPL